MPGRILYLDAYDSFSNNIIALLRSQTLCTVTSIKIDDPRFVLNDEDDEVFACFLQNFDAVVAGPGPGHPSNATDIGLIGKLWTLPDKQSKPVLGICLGFQSLCLAFGASVEKLREPRHGLVTKVTHNSRDLYAGAGDVLATQYHSLNVRLHDESELKGDIWTSTRDCKELTPLAWDLSDVRNGPILMGARHTHKPFWGVQYHPESICTNEEGKKLVQAWWYEVLKLRASTSVRKDVMQVPVSAPDVPVPVGPEIAASRTVKWLQIVLQADTQATEVVELLREPGLEPILLESGLRDSQPINSETGRYSIIALPGSASFRWSVTSRVLTECDGARTRSQSVTAEGVLARLQAFVADHKATGGCEQVPFWGGLVGFISYEAGLETIAVSPAEKPCDRPDIWFVFAERSVVIDHVDHLAYVQSICDSDQQWLVSTADAMRQLSFDGSVAECEELRWLSTFVREPDQAEYCSKVSACQAHLRDGSSYELCLTDQTLISSDVEPWALYKKLRRSNPAPFGAYLRLQADAHTGISIAGSSPERFLSWSRKGKCQFRPIKGTVKKTPETTRAKAEELLNDKKERAENLMIVDLIRHDLHGVKGYVSFTCNSSSHMLTSLQRSRRPRPQTNGRRRIRDRLPARLSHRRHRPPSLPAHRSLGQFTATRLYDRRTQETLLRSPP